MFDLGLILLTVGGPQVKESGGAGQRSSADFTLALDWMNKAATGNPKARNPSVSGGVADAAYNLGVLYQYGDEYVQSAGQLLFANDFGKAKGWYELAKELGKDDGDLDEVISSLSTKLLVSEGSESEVHDVLLQAVEKSLTQPTSIMLLKLGNSFANNKGDYVSAGKIWYESAIETNSTNEGEGGEVGLDTLLEVCRTDDLKEDKVIGKPGGTSDWTVEKTRLPIEIEEALPGNLVLLGTWFKLRSSTKAALENFQKAHNLGSGEAAYILGGYYDDAPGCGWSGCGKASWKRDEGKAREFMISAKDRGEGRARAWLTS